MSKILDFECDCGEKFSLTIDSNKVDYETYCEGGDDLCTCGGVIYQTDCPKCGETCEWDY